MAKTILGFTFEKFIDEVVWVVKMDTGARFTGTYSEIEKYADQDDVRDVDVVCAEGQPEHLRNIVELVTDHYGRDAEGNFLTFRETWELYGKESGDE